MACQVACAPAASKEASEPSPTDLAKQAVANPLPPEKAQEMLHEAGENWLYGNGLGETAFAVGTIVVFPLAAIYWVGNAALSATGHDTVGVHTVLPEESRAQWNGFYDQVSGAPGRVSAAVAGREFITREQAKDRLMKYMPTVTPTVNSSEVPSTP
ncbi:MAG: hypothetical protein J0M12_07040 [Deltaproteobacteria bacterium]|nr:hypothetical protein [Deltaproteobacteria bacterium]